MSGELVEVLGKSAWFASDSCPEELRTKRVSLKSSDGETFPVTMAELWFARKTASHAIESRTGAVIPVPFPKGIVAKLVEYFQYHKDVTPSEIRTPLKSENLTASGASKWDANYISVEKDVLFNLMVAASVMDIPSLLFLCAAKAASLVRHRSPDKLIGEFKLSNDLPKEEVSVLAQSFAEEQGRRGAIPDSSGIGGVAVVLNSVLKAASKAGVLGEKDGAPTADALKSFRLASWRAMVLADWTQLEFAPLELREDLSLVSAVIASSHGQALKFAGSKLRKDEQLVLQAVQLCGMALAHADDSLRASRPFVVEAVAARGDALEGAGDALRSDQDLILETCAKGHGSVLKGATESLRDNGVFVLKCASLHGEAIKHASDRLLNDKALALKVASANGLALQHMLPKFKADAAVVRAAVASNPAAVVYAHTCVRAELGLELPQDSAPKLAAMKKAQDEAGPELDFEGNVIEKPTPLIVGPFLCGAPLSQEVGAAKAPHCVKAMKIVQFGTLSSISANMGQANYIAASSLLDKLPFLQRPEVDSTTVLMGAVGNIGMRWKAFASADVLNANPETLMGVTDATKVMNLICTTVRPSECCAVAFFDDATKSSFLKPTAKAVTGSPVFHAEDAIALDGQSPAWAHEDWSEPGPLGAWPELGHQQPAKRGEEPPQRKEPGAFLPDLGLELAEGGKVLFKGLQAKTGVTGTLLQRFSNGRWKVSMDDGTGNAILKAEYLLPLALAPAAA